jgi:parallel beta-helix repeat protein
VENALTIINTDKHVIIRDNSFVKWTEPLPPQDPYSELPDLPNHRGIRISSTSNITVEDNIFKDCNEGIYCSNSDVVIRNNTYTSMVGGDLIIFLNRQINSLIENNIFQSCQSERGIRIYRAKYDSFIRGNIFQNCDLGHGAIDFTESEFGVNVSDNVLSQVEGYSIIGYNGEIINNTLSNCEIGLKLEDSIVSNNLVESSEIGIAAAGSCEIYHNDFIDNNVGIGFYMHPYHNSTVFRNLITGNEKGIYCITNNQLSIQYNNIYGNNVGIKNQGEISINALYNWWGASNGPGGQGDGDGDTIVGYISYTPWLSDPVLDAGRRN